jgi:type I restriction enzyme S subunit
MNKDVMGVQEVSPGYGFVAENPAVPVGYKQTEVGVIPEDWEIFPFGEHFSIYAGGDAPKHSLSSTQSDRHPYPVFANAIQGKGLYGFTAETRSKPDSVTVTARGYLGHAEYRSEPFFPIVRLLVLEPKGTLDSKYTSYAINDRVQFSIESTGVPQLTAPQVARYAVAAPPDVKEQKAIATALSDVDALLEELDRLIAKKRDIKQAAMQQLLTGETRLPGFEGKWDSRSLLQIADSQKALFDDGDWVEAEHITDQGIRLVQTGNIGEGVFVDKATKKYIYDASFEKLRCKELKQGDILICRLAEPAGRACVFPDIGENRAITSVDVTIFRPRPEVADRQYLVQYFSTSDWFKMVLDHVGGTTHKRISRGALGKLKVPFPPIEEQKAIAEILSDIDTEIQALEHRRSKTAELKQGMMQELLTGRTRLV